MKKCFFLLIVSSFLLIPLVSQSSDKEHNLVFIKEVTGKVEIRSPGANWQPAAPGMGIQKNGEISTGFKSMAVVEIGNSVVTIKPLTRLYLSEISSSGGQEKVNLNLPTGRIHANVKPPAAGKVDFTVRSPEVTASVLGTELDFDGFNVAVSEGTVSMQASQGGQQANVSVGESLSGSSDDINRGASDSVLGKTDIPAPAGLQKTESLPVILPAKTGNIYITIDFE